MSAGDVCLFGLWWEEMRFRKDTSQGTEGVGHNEGCAHQDNETFSSNVDNQ